VNSNQTDSTVIVK